MSLPELNKQPTFHITVRHPADTPVLQTSNFSYTPYFSTHPAKPDISSKELMERAEEARDWLKAHQGSSAFGFVYDDGTYEMYPSNECLGLINCPKRFMQDKPVAYFIGASGSMAKAEKGVDWLINRSPFAKVFVTKNAKELLSKGIIMNTDHSVGITVCALRSLYAMIGGAYATWEKWAELVPEDIAWPFSQYLQFVTPNTVSFSDGYSWSGTMSKNIGIDGIKRFVTHDYSLQDKTPMRVKPYRYEDFSHQWRTHDKAAYTPFKPDTITKSVTKKNPISGTPITSQYKNAVAGASLKEVAANLLNYIGYPYAQS